MRLSWEGWAPLPARWCHSAKMNKHNQRFIWQGAEEFSQHNPASLLLPHRWQREGRQLLTDLIHRRLSAADARLPVSDNLLSSFSHFTSRATRAIWVIARYGWQSLPPLFFCLPLSLSTAQTSSVRGSTVRSTLSRMNASVHNRLASSLLSFHLKHLARRRLQLSKIIARTFARNCQSEISQLFCPFNTLPQILNWSCWHLHFARLPLLLLLLLGVKAGSRRLLWLCADERWAGIGDEAELQEPEQHTSVHPSPCTCEVVLVVCSSERLPAVCRRRTFGPTVPPADGRKPPRTWTLRRAVGHFSPGVVFLRHLPAKWVLLILYMLPRKVNSDFISCLEVRKTIKPQNKEKQGV